VIAITCRWVSPVLAGADVGGQRHLADVEREAAHHAAKRLRQHRHRDEIEGEGAPSDLAVLEGGATGPCR